MQNLNDSLKQTRSLIEQAISKAGRKPNSVELLAVSKKHSAASIRHVFDLGQTAFGENYVQEALEKQQLLADLPIKWHFIGPIQSNKTRQIAEHFAWVHSVDRLKIAERLSKQRPDHLPPLNICLQANIDEETSKSGFTRKDVLVNAARIAALPKLRLRGLMAIPAPRNTFAQQLTVCQQVQGLFTQLKSTLKDCDTLSMGMSGDLTAAVAAGSTMVRVGTGIFGARSWC